MTRRLVRFLLRHRQAFGPVLRRGPVNRWLGRQVWSYLEAQPGFNEGLRKAEAELAAGGGVSFEPFRHRDPAYWRRKGVL